MSSPVPVVVQLPEGARWAGDEPAWPRYPHLQRGPFWRYYQGTTVYTGKYLTAIVHCDTEAVADEVIALLTAQSDEFGPRGRMSKTRPPIVAGDAYCTVADDCLHHPIFHGRRLECDDCCEPIDPAHDLGTCRPSCSNECFQAKIKTVAVTLPPSFRATR